MIVRQSTESGTYRVLGELVNRRDF